MPIMLGCESVHPAVQLLRILHPAELNGNPYVRGASSIRLRGRSLIIPEEQATIHANTAQLLEASSSITRLLHKTSKRERHQA
jgi:hypothetical protein